MSTETRAFSMVLEAGNELCVDKMECPDKNVYTFYIDNGHQLRGRICMQLSEDELSMLYIALHDHFTEQGFHIERSK